MDKGTPDQFRVWASGCCHVGTDLRKGNRESLADAIRQSEDDGSGFGWDIALHLGDFSGNQGPPGDDEGREVVRQFGALRKHGREQFYCLAGNHDATSADDPPQWWFRKWVDPTGENAEHSGVRYNKRPFPVEGTWERYAFRVGNLLFLMMSDRNDGEPPMGRGRGELGGNPGGVVTAGTFDWWRRMVESNRDHIIITAHHYVLKETTVASGPYEGFTRTEDGRHQSYYHGYKEGGSPAGASYLHWVGSEPDAGSFEAWLAGHPGAVDLWLGGHTHTCPDDRKGGRSHIETKWGIHFINAAALTRYHVTATSTPMSRLLTFVDGSDEVAVACYLHTSDFAPQGWYAPAKRVLKLTRPFRIAEPA